METVVLARFWPQSFSPFLLCLCLVLLGSLKESQAEIKFTEQPQNTIAIYGKPVNLNCTATAPRRVRYVWYLEGTKVPPDSRIQVQNDGTLHFTKVDKNDAGNYQCVAFYREQRTRKKITKRSKKAELQVQSLCSTIRLVSAPEGPVYQRGAPITLKCRCNAFPRATTRWTKDDSKVTSGGRISLSGNKLTLNKPTTADSGNYKCSVTNILGTRNSSVVSVQIRKFVEPLISARPQDTMVAVGQSVLLPCKASGVPEPAIRWFFNKERTPLTNTSSYTIYNNGSLLIKSIKKDQYGTYKCEAKNIINSPTVVVTITRPYIWDINLKKKKEYAEIGKEFLLPCKASGQPEPNITWLKEDGGTLPAGFNVINGNTLRHSNFSANDGGKFTCTAKNKAGSKSFTVEIIPSVLPTFKTIPRDTLVQENKKIVLTCAVKSQPESTILWKKDNYQIIVGGNRTVINGGNLTIKRAIPTDTGMYQCIARHPSTHSEASGEANVTVLAAVRLRSHQRTTYKFNKGTNNTVECYFYGHTPITVKWERIRPESMSKRLITNRGKLVFIDMDPSDGGEYACTGSNSFSNYTELVNVFVNPKFELKPKNTTGMVEDSVWLHCNASGYPKPKISWGKEVHGGDKLDEERFHKFKNGTLHVEKIQPGDQGRYYCIAANKASFKQITVSLRVVAPPGVVGASKSNAMGRTIGIAVGCAAAYIILVVGLMIYCKSRRAKQQKREQLAAPIDGDLENCDGNPDMALQPMNGKPSGNYNKMEFPRHDLEALRTLGNGSYGRAFLARASGIKDGERDTMVVVKSLMAKDDILGEDFRREMEAMVNMDNPHVVSLLGVCRESEPLYMIFESLEKGDLKQYLLSCYDNGRSTLTSSQKLSMCSNVVSGMTYLAAKNFIHKDVAARNCMVTNDLQVKIGFLSLSYDLYNSEYYRFNNILIPLRWMAPEAIFNDDFTEKSDVWSFGVLAWEIYTMGRNPYEDRSSEEVLKCVKDDLRLPKPDNCPDSVASVMTKCWDVDPDTRPTFEKIYAEISEVAVDSHV